MFLRLPYSLWGKMKDIIDIRMSVFKACQISAKFLIHTVYWVMATALVKRLLTKIIYQRFLRDLTHKLLLFLMNQISILQKKFDIFKKIAWT